MAYFKNTLESHNKIGLASLKDSKLGGNSLVEKAKIRNTPIQNLNLYKTEVLPADSEIERQLPQMMKFFESVETSKKSKG